MEIKTKLQIKYPHLKKIFISKYVHDYHELKKRLSVKASFFFENLIAKHSNPRVGIGGGSTLYEMINNLKIKNRKIRIYPTALIGRGPELNHIDSTFLAKLLYFKSQPQSKAFVIGLPPLPSDKNISYSFLRLLKREFKEVMWLVKAMKSIDIAFIGLGGMVPTDDFDGELEKIGLNLKYLLEHNVVGGINYNWFDHNGVQIADHFLTIGIDNLTQLATNRTKDIVLVAGGAHKITPIKIALEKKMVNSLVTDKQTVLSILGVKHDN